MEEVPEDKDNLLDDFEDLSHLGATEEVKEEESEETSLYTRFRRGMSGLIKKSVTVWMSEETEKQFEEVLSVGGDFFSDVEHGSLRSLVGMRVLANMAINQANRTGLRCQEEKILRTGFYFFQFAEATFGWSLLHVQKGMENGFSMQSNEIIAQKYLKLKKEDIIHCFFGAELHTPGHILCVDHRTKSIVIAVRGTFSMKDIMTDLVARQTSFLDGMAHEGMAKSCEQLFMLLIPKVVDLLEKYPEYSLVTTGHSLGASVAVMLALRVREAMPELEVSCWAYGCPPCVSWNLANKTTEFCVSFAAGVDIVPRLSLEHMTDLKKRLKVILAQQSTGFWAVVKQGAQVGSDVEQQLIKDGIIIKSGEDLEWCESLQTEIQQKLWGPPRIIDLYVDEEGTPQADDSSLSQFDAIVVGPNMFKDHMPQSYDTLFRKLLTKLEEDRNGLVVEMKPIAKKKETV